MLDTGSRRGRVALEWIVQDPRLIFLQDLRAGIERDDVRE